MLLDDVFNDFPQFRLCTKHPSREKFFDTQCLHYKNTQNKEPDINIELDSSSDPPGIYLFKVNNGNARTMCKICLNLIIKTQERCA